MKPSSHCVQRPILLLGLALLCQTETTTTPQSQACSGTTYITQTTLPPEITKCAAFTGDIHVGSFTIEEETVPSPFLYDFGDLEYIIGSLAFEDIAGFSTDDNAISIGDSSSRTTLRIDNSLTVRNVQSPVKIDYWMTKWPPYSLWFENSRIIGGYYLDMLLDWSSSVTLLNTTVKYEPDSSWYDLQKDRNLFYSIHTGAAIWIRAIGNRYLDTLSVSTQYAESDSSVSLQLNSNAANLSVSLNDISSATPNLTEIEELSAPALQRLRSNCLSHNFLSPYPSSSDYEDCSAVGPILVNGGFQNLSLPKLTHIDQLDLVSNADLASLFLPSLSSLGSMNIYGNPLLSELDFPELTKVHDELNISGSFTSIALPSITEAGSLRLLSETQFDCQKLDDQQRKTGFVQDAYICGNSTEEGHDTTSKHGLSKGQTAGVAVAVTVVVMAGVCISAFKIRRLRNRRKAGDARYQSQKPELDGKSIDVEEKAEADGTSLRELPHQEQVAELPDNCFELSSPHGLSETDGRERYELDAG